MRAFQELEVPLVPPLAGQRHASFEPVDLKRLASLCTGLNSEEAIGLLKEHVLNTIKEWNYLVRDFPLQLALFQIGQVYSMSILFGYSLRQVDTRYRLEKRVRATSAAAASEANEGVAAGHAAVERLSPSQMLSGEEAPKSMKEYVASLGQQDHHHLLRMVSREAEAVMERQVSQLFGDLPSLTTELVQALGPEASTRKEEVARLQQAIVNGEVQSVTLTVSDLRRLALEGAAFGFLLGDAESHAASIVDLAPGSTRFPLLAFGSEGTEEVTEDIWSQGFRLQGQ
jgi:hypothetical protein